MTLASVGRKRRAWAPDQRPGRAGSLSGRFRATGEEGHSSTKGLWAVNSPVTCCPALRAVDMGCPEAGALRQTRTQMSGPSHSHSGLPGQREGGRGIGESSRVSVPTGVGEEKVRRGWVLGTVQVGLKSAQPQNSPQGQAGCLPAVTEAGLSMRKGTGLGGQGSRCLPQPQGHTHNFKDPFAIRAHPAASLCLSSALPFPLPSQWSLPSWECQSARCRNLGEQHSLKTCSGWWPRLSPTPIHPGESKAGSTEGQG